MPTRRQYLSFTATAITASLAGCAGTSDSPGTGTPADGANDAGSSSATAAQTDDPTTEAGATTAPDPMTAAIGELVEGDRLNLVVEAFQRGVDLGEYYDAESGNEFAVVSLALQNTSTEYVTVSDLLQTRLQDDAYAVYEQTFAGTDAATVTDGQVAPGEVERGGIPFEIPTAASGLDFLFDVDGDIFGGINMVIIDLQAAADSVHPLEPALQVDIHDLDDPIEHGSVPVTVTEFRTARSLGQSMEPAAGTEYAIVDVSVTNNTGDQQAFSAPLPMLMKDGEGYTYQVDRAATVHLDRAFDERTPLGTGETRHGQLAYPVPEGESPLYWVFAFDRFTSGPKTFWQVQ